MVARQGPCGMLIGAVALGMVGLYRLVLAPFLGGNCRFTPSCSLFAQQVLRNFPVVRALGCITCRLACCHPWHSGGHDPAERAQASYWPVRWP